MRSLIASFVLMVLFCGSSISCVKPPPNLTPEGQTAYDQIRIIDALDVLRNAATAAYAQKKSDGTTLLSRASYRQTILLHRTAIRAIRNAQGGYKVVVLGILDDMPTNLAADEWALIQPYIVLAKTILNGGGA